MGKPLLGYWNVRGLCEPIRFLLHYNKVDFEEKRYDTMDQIAWKNDKFKLDLDFPNIPYYIDGDLKITQSTTILRYLARKYGMDGKDDKQKLRVSLAEQQIIDLRLNFGQLIVREDYNETLRTEFIKKIPDLLKPWENFIGNHKFLTGDNITYVDFMAYDVFDYYRLLHAEALKDFPKLKAFQDRIKALPELQEYINSSSYKKWPFAGPIAKFGARGEAPKHL